MSKMGSFPNEKGRETSRSAPFCNRNNGESPRSASFWNPNREGRWQSISFRNRNEGQSPRRASFCNPNRPEIWRRVSFRNRKRGETRRNPAFLGINGEAKDADELQSGPERRPGALITAIDRPIGELGRRTSVGKRHAHLRLVSEISFATPWHGSERY